MRRERNGALDPRGKSPIIGILPNACQKSPVSPKAGFFDSEAIMPITLGDVILGLAVVFGIAIAGSAVLVLFFGDGIFMDGH